MAAPETRDMEVQCGWDGQVFGTQAGAGYGAIVRDSGGNVMPIFLGRLSGCRSPYQAESMECW